MNSRHLLFIEGNKVSNFWPLCVSRPPYLLRCGASLLWEKWVRHLEPSWVGFFCRPALVPIVVRRTLRPVNELPQTGEGDFWVLDGRWLPAGEKPLAPDHLPSECAMLCEGRRVGLRFGADRGRALELLAQSQTGDIDIFSGADLPEVEVSGTVIERLWDIVDNNHAQIEADFRSLSSAGPAQWPRESVDQSAVVLNPGAVWIGDGAEVAPQVVLDARRGAIIVEREAVINPHTYIEGPAVIGAQTRIFGGRIRAGTTIGPVCRIGGEVEASVFLGYANKYHDGFIGHSVIGEWVNLGALTTNSDVKNNYRPVRVEFPEGTVETGRIKVGVYLADHTKTGIGTLLPTGGVMGLASNLFGGGEVAPKMMPEFTWVGGGKYEEYRLAEAKDTAAKMCRRRGVEFEECDARLFDMVFEQSKQQREAFLSARSAGQP